MAHVITENCDRCKYTDCVEVCPVDCFHEGETMLFINPETCIDCGACIPECPVEAIYYHEDLPSQLHRFLEINEKMSLTTPVITEKKDPLPGALTIDQLNSGQKISEI